MAVLALVAAGCGSSGPPKLGDVLLKASQVGPGYVMKERADSHKLAGYVTLDLCGSTFPSESLRTARLQVNYVKDASSAGVSNEVVSYKSGGTQQALGELAKAASSCPNTPVQGPVAGQPATTYRLTRLTDPALASGYLAFRIDESATVNGRPQSGTGYAVYQAKGDILSAIYVVAPDPAAGQLVALHSAEQAAHNLGAR